MASHSDLSLKSRLNAAGGGPVFTAWCQMPGEEQAAHMVRAGFAGALCDLQHGTFDYDSMRHMLRAVALAGGMPMMRPPLDDFGLVARALDAGASVIIAPMINTVDDAMRLADAAKYPPMGSRSFGPATALSLWQMDAETYLSRANELTSILAMIETSEAIANLDAILGVDGIDGVFVGPYDLSISLSGGNVGGAEDPDVAEALPKIAAAAKAAGRICGIYASGPDQAHAFSEMGYNLVSATGDAALIAAGAKSVLDNIG